MRENPMKHGSEATPEKTVVRGGRTLRRIGGYLVMVLLVSLLFTGCGGKNVPGERVEQDIRENIMQDLPYGTVESIEIVDRSTDSSNRTDRVYVEAHAQGEDCAVSYEYVMEYYRYDNKWELQDCSRKISDFELLYSVLTEEDAAEVIRNSNLYGRLGWGDISLVERTTDLEFGTDTFVFDIIREREFVTESYRMELTYDYSNYGWLERECIYKDDDMTGTITGEWSIRNGDANVWLNILNCDDGIYELEYEVTCYHDTWYTHELKTVSSMGTVTVWPEKACDYENDMNVLRLSLGDGIDQNGELADAGVVDIYPDLGPRWWGVSGGEWFLEPSQGEQSRDEIPLHEMVADGYSILDYMEEEITDQDENIHFGYFSLRSSSTVLGHFAKTLTYSLNGEYSTFSGTCFASPDMQSGDSIAFIVYCDGEIVYETEELTSDSPVEPFAIDVSGVSELTIKATSSSSENDGPTPEICLTEAMLER